MTNKNKKIVYNKVFGNELGKEVLSDLRRICFATQRIDPTDANGRYDPYVAAMLEGRRQVFLEIANTMQVDFEDYYEYTDFD